MKGLFIPEITAEMFRNGCLGSIEALMAEGEIYDIDYQQPCDDCISRQAVLDGLASIAKVKARSNAQKSLMGRIMFFVEQLPPVTPKEKTGRWVKTPKAVMGEGYMWYCDKCEHQVYQDSSRDYPSEKYCPNCGAKMQEVENEKRGFVQALGI